MGKEQAPPPYTFFVKTEEALHQGGFTLFDQQVDDTLQALEKEAIHTCERNNHKLVSWGLIDSSGKVFKEFTVK